MAGMVLKELVAIGTRAVPSATPTVPLSIDVDEAIFTFLVLLTVISFPAWIVLICMKRFQLSIFTHLLQFGVYGVGCAAVNFSPLYEPTGIAHKLLLG